jgi:glutamine amidotransferase
MGMENERRLGLGLVPGTVVPLQPASQHERIPHIGWNAVHDERHCPLLAGIPENSDFYFVHSYHFQAKSQATIQATTPSYGGFASIVGRDNIFGTQFHPEKSQGVGFMLLKNFLRL